MTVLRPRAIAVALFAFLFAVNIHSAFATHFRYGTMFWEKNLAASTTTSDTYIVTAEVSMRWSFPWGGTTTNFCPSVPGWVPETGSPTVGGGSCAPVGTVAGLGSIVFNKAVTVNGVNTTSTPFNATIVSVTPSTDTMFARMTFTVVVPKATNPVLVSWANAARISTLLEGNADQSYRLEVILDHTKGTKSPRSVSLPTLNVTTGVQNEVFIPTVAFDNFTNKLSFATLAQSALVRAVPGTSIAGIEDDMVIDATSTLVRWTPSLSGRYAVQFRITSYDSAGVEKASVPLDLIFNSQPASPTDPAISLTTPLTTVIFPIGVTTSFALTSQLTPATAGYSGILNSSPLPPGASLNSPSCTGLQPCVRTVSWQPTLQSTSSVVCFQAQYSSVARTLQSPGMLCVNMLLGALPTTMMAFPASGVAGGPVTLSARLTRQADGAAIIQQNVMFSWADTGELLGTGVTDNTGLARVSPIIVEPITQGRQYVATFNAVVNEYLHSSATQNAVVVAGATGSPNTPVLTPLPTVGVPITATVHLNRLLTPTDGGLNGVLQPVTVRVTDPAGNFAVGTGMTDMSGNAVVSVPLTPSAVGVGWSAFARFEGTTSLAGNTQSPTANFAVFQRIDLALSAPAQITPGIPFQVTGTVRRSPQDQPLSGRVVTLTAAGAASPVQAGTNASGQFTATMVIVPGTPLGGVTINGSTPIFNNNPLFEVNSDAVAALETASTGTALVNGVATEVLVSPITAISGQPQTLTATLRETASGAPVANVPVSFSIIGGAGLGTANTNASGVATVTFTPGAAETSSFRAAFSGAGAWLASNGAAALTINKAATSLQPLTLANVEFVGNSLSVSTTLSRSDAPAGLVSGAAVAFKLTAPDGAVTTLNANTNVAGEANVSFPLTQRGVHQVTATYAGSASLATASRSADVTVYQKTYVVANAAHGVATEPIALSAGVFTLPNNAPLANVQVTFDFGAVVPGGSSVTNAQGIAEFTSVFAVPGTYQLSARFENLADYFVDAQGNAVPSTGSASVEITTIATTLGQLQVPSMTFVGDNMTFITQLRRTTAPARPLANAPVTFKLTSASGAVVTLPVNTNHDGVVHATFPATQVRGAYTIEATFGPSAVYQLSSTSATFNVYQRTRIQMAPIAGAVAGVPVSATATVIAIPQNTAITSGQVAFSTSVAGIGPVTGSFDAGGVASAQFVFPLASPVSVAAMHIHPSDEFFANSLGQLTGDVDATTNASVPVNGAPSAFSPVAIAATAVVGNATTAATTLTRADNNAPMAGRDVTFTFTSPANAVSHVSGQTDANGAVAVTFTPSERGAYAVSAAFGGDGAVFATTSAPAALTVYQRVALTLSAPGAAIAGQDITLTASLTTVPGNTGIAGQSVAFASNAFGQLSATTDASGVATVTVAAVNSGTMNAQATFQNTAGFFVNDAGDLIASTASAATTIDTATTSLTDLTAPNTGLVQQNVTVSTSLTRTSAPAGQVAGASVVFTVTDPVGATLSFNGTTLADGAASATFTPAMRGVHTVSASYAGNTALAASSSNTVSVAVSQPTQLSVAQATGAAGTAIAVSATLTSVPQGTLVAGQAVTFSFDGVVPPATAQTDGNGVASVNVMFPNAGSFAASASFQNAADFFVGSTASGTVAVTAAATALSAVSGPSSTTNNQHVEFTTTLTRADGVAIGAGRDIYFTITQPDGTTFGGPVQTAADGSATWGFSSAQRGVHTISAAFNGDAGLLPSTAAAASMTLYQRASLSLGGPASGGAGAPATFSARLGGISNIEVPGQAIEFTFGGGIPPQTIVTNNNGIAEVTVSYPESGTFTVIASFLNPGAFFTNRHGALPPAVETNSVAISVAKAATALSAVSAPAGGMIAGSVAISATLSRNDGIAIAPGASIAFTVTSPDGTTTSLNGSTDANGLATVTFTPALKGVHTVSAAFATTISLEPAASSSPATVTVYQRTQLAVAPATGSATKDTNVSAALTMLPGGTPLPGQLITFAFNGPGAPASKTATTDALGVATVTVKFPSVATYTVVATFENGASFYADSTGAFPVVATTATGIADITNNVPSFTAPANITTEATGPGGAAVTFTANGSDIEDGTLAADCQALSGSTFPLGTTTVSCTVTDSAGATASGSFSITVQDTTPPALTVPANITADATSPAGAVIGFTATAFDTVSLAVAPVCTPAGGSTFAIGTATVNCTATDAAANQSSGSFTVTIRTPQQMSTNLQQAAAAAGMSQGDNNLNNLLKFLNGQATNNAACNSLSSFIKKAQKLPPAQGAPVIAAAMNLWATIPCGGTP